MVDFFLYDKLSSVFAHYSTEKGDQMAENPLKSTFFVPIRYIFKNFVPGIKKAKIL